MKFKVETLEQLLFDPVLAAYALMGMRDKDDPRLPGLDIFQQSRLRYMWWVPNVVDSSGVSTGKTIVNFLYVNLRCILIPNHYVGVYFPNHAVGIGEFWPYFDRFMEGSPIYRSQLLLNRGKLGESKAGGTYVMNFKNGSRIIMPAPNFMNDASTQATRRFNTLVVDDWLRAEDMGDGIGKQLVDRTTREGFNQNHPIWSNHLKFLGHAETPQHKGYARVQAYRRAVKDGSVNHALITFSYKDWTPKYAKRLLIKKVIREAKMTLSQDQFRRQWLGIWSRDGAAYYPESVLTMALRSDLFSIFKRLYGDEVNILGFDVAAGQTAKADWCAGMVQRIVEIRSAKASLPSTYALHGRNFNVSYTFGHLLRNIGAPEVSGFIHLLHRVFGFSMIVLDPGGGGLWVYKELKRPEQLVENQLMKVTPLCTPIDATLGGDRQPIIHFAQRGSALGSVFEPQFLVSDDGFIDAAHRGFRQGWEAREFLQPQLIENRSRAQVAQMTPQQKFANQALDTGFKQLLTVRQITRSDGTPQLSRRGFAMFDAKGKKDAAYAMLYARIGAQYWFKQFVTGAEDDGDLETM